MLLEKIGPGLGLPALCFKKQLTVELAAKAHSRLDWHQYPLELLGQV
jgi:hypothetical protein